MNKQSIQPRPLANSVKAALGIGALTLGLNQAASACDFNELELAHGAQNCMYLNGQLLYSGSGPAFADFTNGDPPVDRELEVQHADMTAFANADGRVSTTLIAGGGTGFDTPHVREGLTYPLYKNRLHWKRTFQKTADDQSATFTLNKRFVEMTWDSTIPGFTAPFIRYQFEVRARDLGSNPTSTVTELPVVYSALELLLIVGFEENYTVFDIQSEGLPKASESKFSSGILLEHDPYRGTINLDEIPLGHYFEVSYALSVDGGTYNDNYSIEADLSDPLDVSDGIEIAVSAPPADVAVARTDCDNESDPMRFAATSSGLAHDRYTGLVWQRCPLGSSLNEQGTPEFDDDTCVADSGGNLQLDWRDALQAAANDTLAGQTDWRLPNVKELESLISACSLPLVGTTATQSATRLAGYWTATPDQNELADARDAWQVNGFSGDVIYTDKSDLGYLRLVRESDQAPIEPIPAFVAGRASIVEGDSGSTTLQMPVALQSPAEQPVSVDYQALSVNPASIDGTDFSGTSGTVTFAPGEQRKTVPITIHGDTDVERDELVRLQLSNPSAGTRIAKATGIGRIIDDEPRISFARYLTRVDEGSTSGAAQDDPIEIPVLLDKPAGAPVAVNFSVVDGSAVAGADFVAASGTLSFAAGEQTAIIELERMADDVPENDERFTVRLSDATGGSMVSGFDWLEQDVVLVNDDTRPALFLPLNDTTIVECATADTTGLSCPQAGFPGQDAETGADAGPSGSDNSDGTASLSFTRLDELGLPKVNQTASYSSDPWPCVLDNNTGLIWEVKTTSFNTLEDNDFRSARWKYTWYDSSGIGDGGIAGTENGGSCFDDNCDSEKYVAAVNAAVLCGFDDWRLPTLDEYYTIVQLDGFYLEHARTISSAGIFANADFNSFSADAFMTATPAVTFADGTELNGNSYWSLTHSGMRRSSKSTFPTRAKIRLVRGND